MKIILALLPTLTVVGAFDYNAKTPMPSTIMSRFANLTKPRLVVPMLVEYEMASMSLVPLGIQLALEALPKRTPYLADYEIEVDLRETYCYDGPVVEETMKVLENGVDNLPLISTFACAMRGQRLVAEAIGYYNYTATALLDIVNEAVQDRERYSNYFVMGATIDQIQTVLLEFMKAQGWSRVVLIGEDHHYYNAV